MKKAYIAPSVESVSIDAQSMLATSIGEVPIEPENPGMPATQELDKSVWIDGWD
jgi:hypothetical protein